MRVLNFGSLNLDYVYGVDHFVRPGETLAALSRQVKCGGKGLNQSIALARAGARVFHGGCVGEGGAPLKALLAENGVYISLLADVGERQGHTVIEVNPEGENRILLYGGSNRCVSEAQITRTLSAFGPGDWLVLQNEINGLPAIVDLARDRGMVIALNPSPWDEGLAAVDFDKLDWLLVNEIEAAQLSGLAEPEDAWAWLHARHSRLSALITLGGEGSLAWQAEGGRVTHARQAAFPVRAVDTTGAGDTYTGYFIAGLMSGLPLRDCMHRASLAAAISVTRPGAADSIPSLDEIDEGGLVL